MTIPVLVAVSQATYIGKPVSYDLYFLFFFFPENFLNFSNETNKKPIRRKKKKFANKI